MGRVTRQASVLPFSSMKKQGQYDKVACQSHQYHCLLPLNVQPGIAPDPEAGHAICAGDRKNSPWPFGDGRLGVREEVDQPRLAVECLSLVPIPSLPALSSGRRPHVVGGATEPRKAAVLLIGPRAVLKPQGREHILHPKGENHKVVELIHRHLGTCCQSACIYNSRHVTRLEQEKESSVKRLSARFTSTTALFSERLFFAGEPGVLGPEAEGDGEPVLLAMGLLGVSMRGAGEGVHGVAGGRTVATPFEEDAPPAASSVEVTMFDDFSVALPLPAVSLAIGCICAPLIVMPAR